VEKGKRAEARFLFLVKPDSFSKIELQQLSAEYIYYSFIRISISSSTRDVKWAPNQILFIFG
jgi:hypothetical protein